MKKKAYAKPMLISETFVPQEYVAACANESSYVGYCDISGPVYLDTNGNGVFDPGIINGDSPRREYTNTACGRKYESQTKPHINAFVVEGLESNWVWDNILSGHYEYSWTSCTPVFNYENVHVTQHIDETLHHNVS